MFKASRVLFLIAETPVHPGSGSEVGIVDLPIQREKYTQFPKIEGSSLKGSFREAIVNSNKKIKLNDQEFEVKNCVSAVFGPEKVDSDNAHAGAISITDAKILFFPVRSAKGVFAWITCPMALERFKKDISMFNHEKVPDGLKGLLEELSKIKDFSDVIRKAPSNTQLVIYQGDPMVVLEEYTFELNKDEQISLDKLAEEFSNIIFPDDSSYRFWKEKMKKDIFIVSDDDFTYFVKNSTEVITRIKIKPETGTVEGGALWTEEYLPQDTVMYSIAMFTDLRVDKEKNECPQIKQQKENQAEQIANFFEKSLPEIVQIGGNQTIGKGLMRIKIVSPKKNGDKKASQEVQNGNK